MTYFGVFKGQCLCRKKVTCEQDERSQQQCLPTQCKLSGTSGAEVSFMIRQTQVGASSSWKRINATGSSPPWPSLYVMRLREASMREFRQSSDSCINDGGSLEPVVKNLDMLENGVLEACTSEAGLFPHRQRSVDTALMFLRRLFLPGGHGRSEQSKLNGRV